jgi:hypothetical protein
MTRSELVLRPHRGVPGVSRTSLWRSWKEIRKKLRDSSLRDVVDWVEYDVDPEKWIRRLLADVRGGRYEPRRPERFTLGKSKGFSRWMTLPAVPDLVLFHALATRIVERAQRRRRRHRHVYFMRDRISAVQKRAESEAREKMSSEPQYRTGFYVWLRFHQYRRWLVFRRLFKYIVVTDISNFFDSIVYTQLEGSLFELGIARNVVGLLFLLLERLSIRDAYSALPRIGLPVDEFDCSRCLAHVVLFPHDDRMVDLVTETAYVRWMDDQTFGAQSEAAAYRLLAEVNASLRRIHLVPNSGKTKILTLAGARRYFHFDLNDWLDQIDKLCDPKATRRDRTKARALTRAAWRRAVGREGEGEWPKILKRFYRVAGCLGLRFLVRRAHTDLLADPALAERISNYLRVVCPPSEFLQRAWKLVGDERIVYADAKRAVFEQFLRLEPMNAGDRTTLRRAACGALRSPNTEANALPADLAALLLLRFGDGRTDRTLAAFVAAQSQSNGARAVGFVLASASANGRKLVRETAERELEGPLRTVSRFVEAVDNLQALPDRIKARLVSRFDPVERRQYLDMRIALIARLFARGGTRTAVLEKMNAMAPKLSPFERKLIARLLR